MDKVRFGIKLKQQREAWTYSQAMLGKSLGVGTKQIQRYENGEVLPSHENLELLCAILSYDFISLLYEVPGITRSKLPDKEISISIEFKTASGKKIAIIPESKKEIELLNAFLEEREQGITQFQNENEKLTKIIESGLIEIKSNLNTALEDLNAIEFGQRAQHTVMLHSLERIEKVKPGTLQKELSNAERAYQSEGVQGRRSANIGKQSTL